jgi:putative FmdB family regulatory protein
MPIYEYICQDCQNEFERIRSFKDADAAQTCNHCQGENIKRQISLFNATSGGRAIAGTGGCNSCAGGSCASCGVH